MHSPYSDGQSGYPYPEEVAHTHHAPYLMPTSVEYFHTVKISAYHTNVPYNIQPNQVGGGCGEERRGVGWVWRGGWEGEGWGETEQIWRKLGMGGEK